MPEPFNIKKFVQGLNPLDTTMWAKSFSISIRAVAVAGLIFFGYGYYKGYKGRPVKVDAHDAVIQLVNGNGIAHVLEIKNGLMTFDGKPITTKDVVSLKPYGIELHPKLAAGITSAGNPTAGLALEVAHAWKLNLDVLAMYQFIGVGVSYDIQFEKPIRIDNTSVGIGYGRDLESDENALIGYVAIEL